MRTLQGRSEPRVAAESPCRLPLMAGVAFSLPLALLLLTEPILSADPRYLEDFRFLETTVAREGAAVASKKVDWKGACERMRPAFEACSSDVEHVKCVLRLLAVLGDSHTGLVRASVDSKQLPSKWDGLYGGGLWFAWEDGRVHLRGIARGHALEKTLPLGSVLVEIAGEPAWMALERAKRRIVEFQGSSSDHSLFSSMGNRFLPFGERQTLSIKVLTPDLRLVEAQVPRWGPGGKAFYPSDVQMPEGLERGEGAVSRMIETPWSAKVGYLRITGSMDEKTAAAFHGAFDALKGMEALLLDCRGMGGGSDLPAWEMAGRLFAAKTPNGPGRTLNPTGSWQFSGPVVMLQDELEVSSAETFTWALSETSRVVSVGRPTGGWAIIPKVLKCPSGLVDFRLGVSDRPTPVRGIRTEGVGWPPDVRIPYGPVACAAGDLDREVGLEVLACLRAGASRDAAAKSFAALFSGGAARFLKEAPKLAAKRKGWKPDRLAKVAADDLRATLLVEIALLELAEVRAPDVRGAVRRLEGLAPGAAGKAGKAGGTGVAAKAGGAGGPGLAARAKEAKLSGEAAKLKKLVDAMKAEAAAQEDLLKLPGVAFEASPEARQAFLERHSKTRLARYLAESLWK